MTVSYDDLFPSRFLKAEMITAEFNTFCVKGAYIAELENESKQIEMKAVLSFTDTAYELTLAKVNGEAIKAMFGRDVSKWAGKRITLHATNKILPYPTRPNDPCIRIFGSPDIKQEITCAWTAPRKREVIQRLQPTVHPQVKKALSAAEGAAPDKLKSIADYAAKMRDEGKLSDPDLQDILSGLRQQPEQKPQAQEPAVDADKLAEFLAAYKAAPADTQAITLRTLAKEQGLPLRGTTLDQLITTGAVLARGYELLRGGESK